MDSEKEKFKSAAQAVVRHAQVLRAIALVVSVCVFLILSTVGIYLRNWLLAFKIQELKDYILVANQPDTDCKGGGPGEWIYGTLEKFKACEARQREDFTHSDKELYDQCIATHKLDDREKYCKRGKEVRIHVFNITNPQDVVEGLTPKIQQIGRKQSGGPFVFLEDCKKFDTEFGSTDVQFSEYCYYTYKHASTEAADLTQEIVTVNVGLLEAIGNSVGNIDYIVAIVWGTLGLDWLNTTTTTAEDYIRGQLLSFSWPKNFGAHFLNHFSPEDGKAAFKARDNARELFEMVLDPLRESCVVNGTVYDRNQCTSMANTLAIYARRYYESYQTFLIHPYNLRYKEGAGLFVKSRIGDLLGYYSGHDDPLSAYLFPRQVSWNAVHSKTELEVRAAVNAGVSDSANGLMNAGPLGRSSVVINSIEDLGSYTVFQGRESITEFDFKGCRPLGTSGQVVVPPGGPYPPQCNGGRSVRVMGSRGFQLKPRLWSLQQGVDAADNIYIFSKTLMRPVKYSAVESVELEAGSRESVQAQAFELMGDGLREARLTFNCEEIYKKMAQAGVLNRGSDCDMHSGMFDLTSISNNIPYAWSLPHFYLVHSNASTEHPLNNLGGLAKPTGSSYRNLVIVEPESGWVVQSMFKEQISIKLDQDSRNYFFTKHKRTIIPLYWKHETRNASIADLQMLSGFQASFRSLHTGFIVCIVLGALSLAAAVMFALFLYRSRSVKSTVEKREKIRAEFKKAPKAPEHRVVDLDIDLDGSNSLDLD